MFEMKYRYSDVMLVPQLSTLMSRDDVDIKQLIFPGVPERIPLISANMDTVTELSMASAMYKAGGIGVLHRYTTRDVVLGWLRELAERRDKTIPSVGLKGDPVGDATAYMQSPAACGICVDVAHAHTTAVGELVNKLHTLGICVVVGNVATAEAAMFLSEAGATYVKVGVGPGAVCTTRDVTGHGYPQLSAVLECSEALRNKPTGVIADGGIRTSGDIVKALAAGATAVMLGYVLAGCDEAPKDTVYRGMASTEARRDAVKSTAVQYAPEGVTSRVLPQGSVSNVVDNLCAGIRSGLSYSGARTVRELPDSAEFIRVSHQEQHTGDS